jgi:hypothetical protein
VYNSLKITHELENTMFDEQVKRVLRAAGYTEEQIKTHEVKVQNAFNNMDQAAREVEKHEVLPERFRENPFTQLEPGYVYAGADKPGEPKDH